MNCEHWFALINARMDGELPPDDRRRLSAHLSECANCRKAADEFENGDRELARLFAPRQQAAAMVADRVLEQWWNESPLRTKKSQLPPNTLGAWKVPVAVAAGFAIAFVLFGWQGTGTQVDGDEARIRKMVSDWRQGSDPVRISELDLRALGSDAVPPLLEVVNNWEGDADAPKRIAAAHLVADLAESSQIPALIALLGDQSAEIRNLSESTLIRLTGWNRLAVHAVEPVPGLNPRGPDSGGPDLSGPDSGGPKSGGPDSSGQHPGGIDPAGVERPIVASCSNPQAEWQQWWDKNKQRFQQP